MKCHNSIIEPYIRRGAKGGTSAAPVLTNCHAWGTCKWCSTTNLSYPEGHGVNDYIPSDLCTLQYIAIDQVTQTVMQLGYGVQLAKTNTGIRPQTEMMASRATWAVRKKWLEQQREYISVGLQRPTMSSIISISCYFSFLLKCNKIIMWKHTQVSDYPTLSCIEQPNSLPSTCTNTVEAHFSLHSSHYFIMIVWSSVNCEVALSRTANCEVALSRTKISTGSLPVFPEWTTFITKINSTKALMFQC